MNIEYAGYVLSTMDFSELGVAGTICTLLLAGMVWVVSHFKGIISDLKEQMKAKDSVISAKDTEIKELNLDIREMEISAITTINKFIEVQNKIYENTRRTQG